MIIMINGAFGVGKTSVANGLNRTIENSMIYDPEEVGYLLRNIVTEEVIYPNENTGDFQDLGLWKTLTVYIAKQLILKYNKNLIVPMTIHNEKYFQYIYDGFKEIDEQTHHFCLVATKETIHKRLIERGEAEGNWCFQQTNKCIKAFKENGFGEFIDTDHINVNEIVDSISEKILGVRG